MEINFNAELGYVARATSLTVKAGAATPMGEGAVFSNSEALNQALANVPDVRTDVVDRGRELASDGHYPPDVLIHKLARLLAPGLEKQS